MSEISISYNSKYGTGVPGPKTVEAPYTVVSADVPTLTDSHHYFQGWYSDSQFTTQVIVGSVLNETTELKAKWVREGVVEIYDSNNNLKILAPVGTAGVIINCKEKMMNENMTVKIHNPYFIIED